LALLAVAVLASGIVVAHASTLGGATPQSLFGSQLVSSPTTPGVLGCDNFTGTNGATLAARAATVAAACNNRTWTVPTGGWQIQTNAAQGTGYVVVVAPTGLALMNTTTSTPVTARCTVTSFGVSVLGATAGVVASYTSATVFLRAQIRRGVLSGLLGDFVELYYGATLLSSQAFTITGAHLLRLTRSGTAVTVRVDANVVISATLSGAQNTALTGGSTGIYYAGVNGVRIDDFAVTGADP
jgi:hypothetical protein